MPKTSRKTKTSKAAAEEESSGGSSPVNETTSEVILPKSGGIIKKKSGKSSKVQKEAELFMADVLPNLRKEMVQKKRANFDLTSFSDYFHTDSGYVPTFILPLFHFIGKSEVICSRYGAFDKRHCVKTSAGVDKVMWVSRNIDQSNLTEELMAYLNQKYSPEWYKIPSTYAARAKAASLAGFEGKFKTVLTNIYFDNFINREGVKVETINPVLSFEPCLPPPPPKIRTGKKKNDKESKEVEEGAEVDVVQPVDVGAQEVPIPPIIGGGGDDESSEEEE